MVGPRCRNISFLMDCLHSACITDPTRGIGPFVGAVRCSDLVLNVGRWCDGPQRISVVDQKKDRSKRASTEQSWTGISSRPYNEGDHTRVRCVGRYLRAKEDGEFKPHADHYRVAGMPCLTTFQTASADPILSDEGFLSCLEAPQCAVCSKVQFPSEQSD